MRKNRVLSLLLAVIMLVGLVVPTGMITSAAELPDMTGKLVVLHTNDTHGRDNYISGGSLGTAAVSATKKAYEKAGADVILLSAGDAVQGLPLVNLSKGETAIDFMNGAGYDAMTLGNHEFDYGFENLKKLEEKADFPFLSANIRYKKDGSLAFKPNDIITTKSGKKVGIFGLTTVETVNSSHPDSVKDLDFSEGEDLYADAQEQVDALKEAGCSYIIALGHLGTDALSEPNRSTDVLKHTNGIDLFIDGHSHTEYKTGLYSSNSLVVSTGCYIKNIGRVIVDGTKVQASLIDTVEFGQDETLKKRIDGAYEEIQKEYNKVFAKTEVDLNGTRNGGDALNPDGTIKATFPAGIGNRTAETNLGDLSAEAQLYAAEKATGSSVDVSIINGGNIRDTIAKGDITKNDIITVFPYTNTIVTLKLTGKELLEVLEAACFATPASVAAFPQIAGVEFTLDCAYPYEKGDKYPDSIYYAPAAPGKRVQDVKVGGQKLDLEKEYTLTTNDYLVSGGDTYHALKEPYKKTGVDTGLLLEDSLIDFITTNLSAVIGSEYADSKGKIKIINLPKKTPSDFTDIPINAWYYTPVSYVLGTGIMTGDGSSTFKPSQAITRAEFYQTLYSMEGSPEVTEKAKFTDVKDGDWFQNAVNWAVKEKLTAGTGDNIFSPNLKITRQEMAKAFADYLEYIGITAEPNDLSDFSDVKKVADWAKEAMGVCVELGIIKGYDGKLDPAGIASRAELSQMIYSISQLPPMEDLDIAA